MCVSNSSTLSLVRVVLNRSRSGEGFWDMDRRLSQSNDPVALFFFPLGDAPSRGGDVSWKGGVLLLLLRCEAGRTKTIQPAFVNTLVRWAFKNRAASGLHGHHAHTLT